MQPTFIIGASRGIGHALSGAFATPGWQVTGTSRGTAETPLQALRDAQRDGRTAARPRGDIMKIIATEEHMMTAEVADAWHALGLESRDPGVAYHQVGEIGERLLDLSATRIALMDEAGVDV